MLQLKISFNKFTLWQISAEILVEPGPGPILTPLGEQALLTCSVTASNWVQWHVELPDRRRPLVTDQHDAKGLLQSRGFIMEGLWTMTSKLYIAGDQTNNRTFIRCLSVITDDDHETHPVYAYTEGTLVQLLFFGK